MIEKGPKIKRLTVGGTDIGNFIAVYPEKPSETLKNAADDLAKYIAESTGKTLRSASEGSADAEKEGVRRIVLGRKTKYDTEKVTAARSELKNNGYAIVSDGGDLFLTGDSDTGVMYGVYSFLEDFVGWRFCSSSFETVKAADSVDIPENVNVSFSPKLIYRDPYWYDTFLNPSFAAKRKINSVLSRNLDGYGDYVKYAGQFVHTLGILSGKAHAVNEQPCLTDPEVYETVLGNVRTFLRNNPDAKIISVSQNDSDASGRGCRCENCRAIDEREGTPMGSLLTFVNKIARAVKEEFPGVYVDTLAYRYTRKAPKTIIPEDNVIIRLCSIECCFSHPLAGGCERNREFTEDIEAWSKICKNLFVWDYTTDFLFYEHPFPNLKVIYDNVRYFADHNVIGLFEQGNYQSVSGEFGELRAYLLSKLLWDPDMSRKDYYDYMDGFLEDYYGAGWQYIRRYVDLSAKLAETSHMGIYYTLDMTFNVEKDKAVLAAEQFDELWKKALELSDDEHRANVEKSYIQVFTTRLCYEWDDNTSPPEKERLYKLMKKYNITHWREGQRLPDEPNYYCPPTSW